MIKKVLCIIMIVLIVITNSSLDIDAKGKPKISYTLKKGVLTIKGKGDSIPSFENNKSIKKVIIKKGITGIPEDTFYGCKNLKKVSLPEGLISIGSGAFIGTGIKKIVVPKSVKYLTVMSISDNVKISWKGRVGLPQFELRGSVMMNLNNPSNPETGKSYYMLNWTDVKGADGYEIYAGKSIKKNKLVKVVDGKTSHYYLRNKYNYYPVVLIRAFKNSSKKKIYGPFCWSYKVNPDE